MYREYRTEELVPGMMVTKVIDQNGPVKIKKVGMVRTPEMVKGLTEMGVERVEVDLEQSIGVDLEKKTSSDANYSKQEKISATNKLIDIQDKVSLADRTLSEQFHRSLFTSATEDMPSRWQLYGKPYFFTAICICLGFSLGFFTMHRGSLAVDKLTIMFDSNSNVPAEVVSAEQFESKQMGNSDSLKNPIKQNSKLQNQAQPNEEPILSRQDVVMRMQAENNGTPQQNESQQTMKGDTSPLDSVTTENTSSISTDNPAGSGDEKLLQLTQGQLVVGYQAPELQTLTPNNVSSSETEQDASTNALINAELLRRVQNAADIVDTQLVNEPSADELVKITDLNAPPRIDELPIETLTRMPKLSFTEHMYASNQQDRWVRVNGKRLMEGDYITNRLQVIEILPESLILSFENSEFTMNALSDW